MRLCLDKLFTLFFFSCCYVVVVIKYSSCYVFCLCPLLKMLTHSIFSYCWVCETFHVLCKLFMLFRMNFHKHFNLIKANERMERRNVTMITKKNVHKKVNNQMKISLVWFVISLVQIFFILFYDFFLLLCHS